MIMRGQLRLGGMAENNHSASVKRGLPEEAEAFRESVCAAFFLPRRWHFFSVSQHTTIVKALVLAQLV